MPVVSDEEVRRHIVRPEQKGALRVAAPHIYLTLRVQACEMK